MAAVGSTVGATVASFRATRVVELRELRVAGGLMLGAAAVRPLVGSPGLPCPLRTLTGIPCPFCGMTTSVTSTVWFDVRDAFAANPMGIVFVVFAVLLLLRRRWERVTVPVVIVPIAMAGMWVFELRRFDIL